MRAGVASLVAATALLGCARGPGDGPPELHFGQDVCAECGMIVSERRYASAAVTIVDGFAEASAFDDLGCFFAWHRDHGEETVSRWVQDASGAGWVPAESAWYVSSDRIRTPMGSGVAAYRGRDTAEEAAGSAEAELLDWNRLRARARTEDLLAPPPAAGSGHEERAGAVPTEES